MEILLLLITVAALWAARFYSIKALWDSPLKCLVKSTDPYRLFATHLAAGILVFGLTLTVVWLFTRIVPSAGADPLRFGRAVVMTPFLILAGAVAGFYWEIASQLTDSFFEALGLLRGSGFIRAYFVTILCFVYMLFPFTLCMLIAIQFA